MCACVCGLCSAASCALIKQAERSADKQANGMRLDQCVSINRIKMPTHGHPHLCITRLRALFFLIRFDNVLFLFLNALDAMFLRPLTHEKPRAETFNRCRT